MKKAKKLQIKKIMKNFKIIYNNGKNHHKIQ